MYVYAFTKWSKSLLQNGILEGVLSCLGYNMLGPPRQKSKFFNGPMYSNIPIYMGLDSIAIQWKFQLKYHQPTPLDTLISAMFQEISTSRVKPQIVSFCLTKVMRL
jgi:hypothetical protein